jgi:HEAT repeat protein
VNSPETLSRRSPSHVTKFLRGIGALLVIAGCRGDDVGSAIDDLSNPDSKIRLRASHELIRHDSAAVEPLIDRATTGSDSLRYISAQVLGRIGDRRALPALKRLAEDSNEHVRRAALVGLGSMGDSGVFDYLVVILSEDALPALRAAAAEGLATMGDTLAVAALVHALADTASSVRKQAVMALHRLWTQQAETAIARVVTEDREAVVRFVAAQSLGQHRAASARDPLRVALRDSSVWVRAEAARSLGELGDVEAIEDLSLLLERGDDGPDHDAARQALQKLHTK